MHKPSMVVEYTLIEKGIHRAIAVGFIGVLGYYGYHGDKQTSLEPIQDYAQIGAFMVSSATSGNLNYIDPRWGTCKPLELLSDLPIRF